VLNSSTAALVLLVFAFTSSSIHPWSSAIVLAPLLISVALIVLFFFYEARVPSDKAAIPPRLWSYHNFGLLIGIAMSCNLIFMGMFFLIMTMWQDVYGWSAVRSAVQYVIWLLSGQYVIPFAACFLLASSVRSLHAAGNSYV
jgi:hypothetical protein